MGGSGPIPPGFFAALLPFPFFVGVAVGDAKYNELLGVSGPCMNTSACPSPTLSDPVGPLGLGFFLFALAEAEGLVICPRGPILVCAACGESSARTTGGGEAGGSGGTGG